MAQGAWLLACHESEVAQAGRYFVFSHMSHSAIILRDSRDTVVAYRNHCLHRGSYLLGGTGKCQAIVCPYHGWRYDLDGRKRGDTSGVLEKLPVRLAAGFVWIYPGKKRTAPAFGAAGVRPYLESFSAGSMKVLRKKTFYLDCNWKNYLENILDAYHIPAVHNPLLGKIAGVPDLEISVAEPNMVLRLPMARRQYYKIYLFPNTVINLSALNATVYNVWPLETGKVQVEYTLLGRRSWSPLAWMRNRLYYLYSMMINREDNRILPKYYANIRNHRDKIHRFVHQEQSLVYLHQILKELRR